jgi:Zn-finger nucleic acid-binding protein
VWLPVATRTALIDDAAALADRRGHSPSREVARRQLPVGSMSAAVKYRKCPACAQPMSRKNFGGCSGVLVDECRCGTFFDAGELEDVLAFVRSGGLLLAKRREDEERTRSLRNAEAAAMRADNSASLVEAGGVRVSLISWLARWLLGG